MIIVIVRLCEPETSVISGYMILDRPKREVDLIAFIIPK